MKKYRINTSEIDKHIKYIDSHISSQSNKEIRKQMIISYKTLISLKYHLSKYNEFFINDFVNKVNKYNSYGEESCILDTTNIGSLKEISLLLDSCKVFEEVMPKRLDCDEDFVISVIYNFFDECGSVVSTKAKKILGDVKRLEFSSNKSNYFHDVSGMCYKDIFFDECYLVINKSNSMEMFLTLGHELMHAIDWKLGRDSRYYKKFNEREIFSKMIEFYILDYLEKIGFDKDDVNDLRYLSKLNIVNFIKDTNSEIKIKDGNNLSDDAIKDLYDVNCFLMGYSLYNIYKTDLESAFFIMEDVVRRSKDINTKVTYSKYGLTDDVLRKDAKEIMNSLYSYKKKESKVLLKK